MFEPVSACLVAALAVLAILVGGIAYATYLVLIDLFFTILCFVLIAGIILAVGYTTVFVVGYFTSKDEELTESTPLKGDKATADASKPAKETGFKTFTPETGFNVEYFQLIFLLLLTFGAQTVVYSTNKIMMQLSSNSEAEDTKPFKKPLFITLCSYIGLVLYLPFSGLRPGNFDGNRGVIIDVFITSFYGTVAMIALFCALALLPVSATIMPMVGGTTIFTVIFSYYAGRTPLDLPIVLSIAVIMTGTGLVMVPSIVDAMTTMQTSDQPIYKDLEGILFMVCNMVFSGLKNVSEELVFTKTKRLTATNFAGLYCLFCVDCLLVVLLCAQFLPGPDNNLQEDSVQTVQMLVAFDHRELVSILLLVAIGARTIWHVMNKTLTQYYGASTNVIVQSVTMFLSWIVAVALYYSFEDQGLGEPFIVNDAIFKFVGGVLILVGNEFYLRNRRAADQSKKAAEEAEAKA